MSLFSFVMGILSLVFLMFGFALPFAALGLILAILSRTEGAMLPRARAGLIMSVIGLAAGLVITITSAYLISSGALEETYREMTEMFENNGDSDEYDRVLEELREMFADGASGNGGGR